MFLPFNPWGAIYKIACKLKKFFALSKAAIIG